MLRLPFSGDPEQGLTDGEVADDLGNGWVGVEALPDGDVLRLVIGEAGEEQSWVADGEVVPVFDVVRVGPLGFVVDEGHEELHQLLQATAIWG